MRAIFICICVGAIFKLSLGQSNYNVFEFRNYSESLALSVRGTNSGSVLLNENGGIVSTQSSDRSQFRYLFQGQEYDFDFGVYFFPSRIYTTKGARFFQPDPKSQYHSSYSFVNADPVNKVDFTGNEGKPLVLYSLDTDARYDMNVGMRDLQNQVRDAYYYPINDFIEGKIEDIPEWNGNVFIKSHMGTEAHNELSAESGTHYEGPKLDGKYRRLAINKGKYSVNVDGEEFGKQLRFFSEQRGVPIQNVVAGGCEGSAAAEAISRGFVAKGATSTGNELVATGLRENMLAHYAGQLSTMKYGNVRPLNETHLSVREMGTNLVGKYEDLGNKQYRLERFRKMNAEKEVSEMPTLKGKQQLGDFMNNRMPEEFAENFHTFRVPY